MEESSDPVNAQLINEKTNFITELQMGPEHLEEVIRTVAENFGIELDDSDTNSIETVRNLIKVIKIRAEEQGANLC